MDRLNKSPNYLKRIGTKYHFRFAFSKRYCHLLTGEIKLSLRTGDLPLAMVFIFHACQCNKKIYHMIYSLKKYII